MKKFLPTLTILLVLLASIPVCILSGWIVLAKIIGIIVVIATAISIRLWILRSKRMGTGSVKIKFTVNDRYFLKEQVPIYKGLPSGLRRSLDERAGLFLSELSFDHYDHHDPSKEECLALAFLLALLTKDKSYTSLKGKTVVLRDKDPAELTIQNGHALLFIGIQDVLESLSHVHQINDESTMSSELHAVLGRFYAV